MRWEGRASVARLGFWSDWRPVTLNTDHRTNTEAHKLMPIVVTLDVMLAKRKMRSKDLARLIGITEQNVSLLKSGKVKGVRFETLEKICDVLDCQPGDLFEYQPEDLPGQE